MNDFVKELVAQGGFAVLAAVLAYLLYKMGGMWASDNKERAQVAEQLQRETLDGIKSLAQIAERLGVDRRRNSSPERRRPDPE